MIRREKIIGTVAYMGGVMSVPEPFAWSLANAVLFAGETICGPDERLHLEKTKLSLHDWGRNDILGRMRGDWVLMLDTDIAFEPDLISRMVATMIRYDLDVVTGIYSMKKPPHHPVLYIFNPKTEQHELIAEWDKTRELIQIDSAGAGCLLVRRRVFERITSELKTNAFDRVGIRGEDHSFFGRLRELGIPAWCAWKIEVQHLEYVGVAPSTHFRLTQEPHHYFERLGFEA